MIGRSVKVASALSLFLECSLVLNCDDGQTNFVYCMLYCRRGRYTMRTGVANFSESSGSGIYH
jgi:hypothetical protein